MSKYGARFARRSDGKNGDWVELYLAEFPKEEQRDVGQLREFIAAQVIVLHETRGKDGQPLTWSIIGYPTEAGSEIPHSGWLLDCHAPERAEHRHWTSALCKSSRCLSSRSRLPGTRDGNRVHRRTCRRQSTSPTCRFYQGLGLLELDVPYAFPLFQQPGQIYMCRKPTWALRLTPQLLIAPFSDSPITAPAVRWLVRRIYEIGYGVNCDDPYLAND